jgi:EmrB/QacA subfamily drug resistance transporter
MIRNSTIHDTSALPAAQPRRRALVAAIYLGTFVALLDVSIVNVALPTIGAALATDLAGLQWVADAYTICLSALMLSAGALGDRYGRKRCWLIGVAVLTLGSAVCAAAPGLGVLLAGRAVQGSGGALLIPGALSILAQAFPEPRQRAQVIGGWASFAALSLILGPILGGVLVEAAGWPSIFLVNLPLGAITLALGAWAIAESAHPDHAALDPAGQVLSVLWLGALTFGLIEAGEAGWTAPVPLALLALAALGLAAFIAVERRVARPMLPLADFARGPFAATNVASFVLGFAGYSSIFLLSLLLQQAQGWSPAATGWAMLPMFVSLAVSSAVAGRVTARRGPRPVMIAGYATMGVALSAMAVLTPESAYATEALLLVVLGFGMGLAIPATSAAAMAAAPRERSGMASATINATRQAGTAIGIALLGAVMNARASALAQQGAATALAGGFRAAILIAGIAALAAALLLARVRQA